MCIIGIVFIGMLFWIICLSVVYLFSEIFKWIFGKVLVVMLWILLIIIDVLVVILILRLFIEILVFVLIVNVVFVFRVMVVGVGLLLSRMCVLLVWLMFWLVWCRFDYF